MINEQASIFTHYTRDLFAHEENAVALKDYLHVPVIIDTLSRKDNHHVLLTGIRSTKIQIALLESIALHLADGNAPKTLRDVDFLFLDAKSLANSTETPEKIMHDFKVFCAELRTTHKRVILAINELSGHVGKLIQSVLMDEHWRFIVLGDVEQAGFTTVKLTQPNDSQLLALLKTFKNELENYHHVLIPDETFASAMSMAMHYLPNHSQFDNAFKLLDSAAARASSMERHETKPIVTSMTLALIISGLTQIPITHLHNNVFQAAKFTETLQRRIFGQDAAISTMGSILQYACIKLQEKNGPLCSFLLVGPSEVGKTTTAYTMAEHLFGHKNALLRVNLSELSSSIADIKIICDENRGMSLLHAIEQTPYAIILIENIHQASAATFNLFKNIFVNGYALDEQGKKYDFRHSIFVVTTTLGAERISMLTQAPPVYEANKTLDLMQLVSSDHTHAAPNINPNLTSQELCDDIMPTLEGYFSSAILQHMNIVPFLPLDYSSLEKIIRLKVKMLAKRLEMSFGIELNYAPEVVKFLAHEALWRKPQTKPMDNMLEEFLYSAVANEILAHAEDKNRSKRLSLQLNEDGQLLRCEFVSAMSSVYN